MENKVPAKTDAQPNPTSGPSSKDLAHIIAELALSKKAIDVRILNLANLSDVTDYFLICSGEVKSHVRAIKDAVEDGAKKIGIRPWYSEGYSEANWIIVDYVDVVVHIFTPDIRGYYDLEGLWGDAPSEMLGDG